MEVDMRGLLLVLLLTVCGALNAAVIPWSASPLAGANEVPPNGSPATGTSTGTYDTVSHVITWDVAYADLTGPLVVGHIHGAAPPGVNAAVLINFFSAPPGLGASGAFSGSADLDGDPLLSAVFLSQPLAQREAQFLTGLWYVNLHTQQFPGGEIRAQMTVPEPGTLALLAAIGVVTLVRRVARR
jgi:hypothetical protein